jgi:hypothetical protein
MAIVKSRRVRACLSIGVIAILCLGIVWMLIGVSIHLPLQSPLEALEQARQRWTAHEYTDYRMRVGFGAFSYVGAVFITVQNGSVSQIQQDETDRSSLNTDTWTSITEAPVWYQTNFSDIFPETLSGYTVNGLFDFAASKLRDEPTPPVIAWCGLPDNQSGRFRYEAQFNDDLGYLESFTYTSCIRPDFGGGLMCGVITDCAASFSISEFEPISRP